jgi:hypothetical protein
MFIEEFTFLTILSFSLTTSLCCGMFHIETYYKPPIKILHLKLSSK